MKHCFICRSLKPLEEFYKHSGMSDGHVGKCKDCNKVDNIRNRNRKIDYYRNYDRNRSMEPSRVSARNEYAKTDRGKLICGLSKKKWRVSNPVKSRAHDAVAKALLSGVLVKESCASCGVSEKETNGHHPDYSRPLHVVWLCSKCHKTEHKRMNNGTQQYF